MNAIEFSHVRKKRKDFLIDDMSFQIPKGYITGFIGPNGSGKTTTIQLLMNILRKDAGDISILKEPNENPDVKQHIGFVYDDLYMYEAFTIKKMKAVMAPLYTNWNEQLFQHYLKQFELPFKKRIKEFSKGMKMKCSLLFALAHEPKLLILDEPTAGLDPIFRRELITLLQDLMLHEEQTIFLSTHNTAYIDQIADYVLMIQDGVLQLKTTMENIHETYHLIKGETALLDQDIRKLFVGIEENETGFTGLFKGDPALFHEFNVIFEKVTVEELMYFLFGGERKHAHITET